MDDPYMKEMRGLVAAWRTAAQSNDELARALYRSEPNSSDVYKEAAATLNSCASALERLLNKER